ncbi:uncharacterized protein PV09_05137 [Verruconis gallopava]|uniref:Peptidase A1 domain-containing protein n=1 Tax=Verruconis gallopava TaxID=253628 RepID=A0A0D2AAN4_9PEZI|nr:uncharacterized protein PV09_05137 [Verruconis gallopava]KIW03838.1 hypothetical protein PV09_05137 [Verruconis gallopava]
MRIQKRATTVPAPIVVNPSQNWYGPDGSWSTFRIQVGTPPQSFDILPSTAASESWVPLPEGCTSSDPTDCPTLRGVQPFNGLSAEGYLTNQSSTYSLIGLYAIQLEDRLAYSLNGQYGTDVYGLNGGNGSSSGGVSLSDQIVAGIASKDFMLGVFGLGIQPTSFSSSAGASQSFMTNLRNADLIPSLSYGYTAGASYRNKKVESSLTLGGYDQSRFTPSNQSLSFSSQDSEVLKVGVQSIIAEDTLLGTTSFTAGGHGHLSVIDSTVPHIWLPRAICDEMESALGLQYDNQTDLYLVNDTMHSKLLSLNPTFTFRLGETQFDNGNGTNIQLPYAAFDLQVGWPIYSTNQNYFPIRRAANDSQYTLGRALLQEAYIVVDYERRNFTVGQAIFTDPMPSSHIVTIHSLNNGNGSSGSLSAGAIAGIAVGAAVAIIALVVGVILWKRKKQSEVRRPTELDGTSAKKRIENTDPKNYEAIEGEATEMDAEGEHRISELPTVHQKLLPHAGMQELPSPQPVFEMPGDTSYEMDGTPSATPRTSVPPSPYHRSLSPHPYEPSPQPSPRLHPQHR